MFFGLHNVVVDHLYSHARRITDMMIEVWEDVNYRSPSYCEVAHIIVGKTRSKILWNPNVKVFGMRDFDFKLCVT